MSGTFSSDLKFSIIPDWLLASDVSDRAVRVYAVLARYADNSTHEAFPRRALIAQGAKCSPRSVDRAIDELVAVKAVSKTPRKDDKGQHSNVYKLHRVPADIKLTPSSAVTTPLVSPDYPPSSPVTTITIPSELDLIKEREIADQFDEFWSVYPKKADKPLALRSFRKALDRVSFETIIDGAAKYRDDPNREKAFTKNPSSWLNADAWENEPLAPKTRRGEAISRAQQNADRLRELERG